MQETSFDVAIVGAGIIGLANAYIAAKAGKSVLVVERDPQAASASVRNFGMIWPVGQPSGQMREMALASHRLWLDVLAESGIWYRAAGSLHLAYELEELAVLEEFCSKGASLNYDVSMLTRGETLEKSPVVRPDHLLGSMWSPQELCVDPRQVVRELPVFLSEKYGVKFLFSTAALAVEEGRLTTSLGDFKAAQILICCGSEFDALCPRLFESTNTVRCKLQMLRARPKNQNYRTGPHLCAGLTLAHYANFQICESLKPYLSKIEREAPEYVRWHIHVLVSQHENGDLTLGDSHEYDNAVTPFNKDEVDRLILAYLDRFLPTEAFDVIERWYGVYAKCLDNPYLAVSAAPNVTAVVGAAGAGMTLSFGLAQHIQA